MKIVDSRITKFYDHYEVRLKYEWEYLSFFDRYILRQASETWSLPARFDSIERAREYRDEQIARAAFVPHEVE